MLLESLRHAYLPSSTWPSVEVDMEKCDGCGRCVQTCPIQLLALTNGHPTSNNRYDAFRCIACDNCAAVCPKGAIASTDVYRVFEGRFRNAELYAASQQTFPRPLGDGTPERFEDYEDQLTETERVIYKRRSVRLFKKKQVPIQLVERIIEAGRFAPSAGNCQPWKFTVVQDPKLIEEVCKKTERVLRLAALIAFPRNHSQFEKKPLHQRVATTIFSYRMPGSADQRAAGGAKAVFEDPDYNLFLHAPTVIFISCDKRGLGIVDLDTALCAENMVLAAHSLGLGTCLIGLCNFPFQFYPGLRKKLDIVPPFRLNVAIALGYPKGACDSVVKREPARVTWL